MIKIILFFLCIIISSALSAQEEFDKWKIVWSDEFNYNGAPDPTKWSCLTGDLKWNNDKQFYTKSANTEVKGGNLVVTAKKEDYENNKYTSALLRTIDNGDWLYGKIEIRAKLPTGTGIWPAIWLKPTDEVYGRYDFASGEIDIMEHVGYEKNTVHSTVHTNKRNMNNGLGISSAAEVKNISNEFHTYSIEWLKDKIDFFVDGNKHFTYEKIADDPTEWPFDQRFYLILNISVGGRWGGDKGIDNSIFPQKMVIDWIRVYQKDEHIHLNKKFVQVSDKNELLKNSDFTNGYRAWDLYNHDVAKSQLDISNGQMKVNIDNTGSESWHIELYQSGINLEKGNTYTIEFEAKAEEYKKIYCAVGKTEAPYSHYIGRAYSITDTLSLYSFKFEADRDDNNARILFDLGYDLDNIVFNKISVRKDN